MAQETYNRDSVSTLEEWDGEEDGREFQKGETDTENRLMGIGRGEERVRCMESLHYLM